MDAEVPITNGTEADGEDVWFWRLDAGVKFVRSKRFTGATEARQPDLRGATVIS